MSMASNRYRGVTRVQPPEEVRNRMTKDIEAGLDKILEDLQWWARHVGCDQVHCEICERRLKDRRDDTLQRICDLFVDQLATFAGEGTDGTVGQDHQETE